MFLIDLLSNWTFHNLVPLDLLLDIVNKDLILSADVVWRGSARLGSAPKLDKGLIGLNCWNSSSVKIESTKGIESKRGIESARVSIIGGS